MPRPRKFTPPETLDALAKAAWEAYLRTAHPIALTRGKIERRFKIDGKREIYEQDMRKLMFRRHQAEGTMRSNLHNALGRYIKIRILATYVGGAPRCVMVRVPNGELVMHDIILGRMPKGEDRPGPEAAGPPVSVGDLRAAIARAQRRATMQSTLDTRIAGRRRRLLMALEKERTQLLFVQKLEHERNTYRSQLAVVDTYLSAGQALPPGLPMHDPLVLASMTRFMYMHRAYLKRFHDSVKTHRRWLLAHGHATDGSYADTKPKMSALPEI